MKFISEISSFYILLLILLSVGIALFLYRGKEGDGFKKTTRWSLIALRSVGLILVGILFFGIFLQTTKNKIEKPILINLIDNSQSMKNYKDSNQVEERIHAYLQAITEKNQHQYQIKNYLIGDFLRESDSINFMDEKTDLSQPFSQIYEQFYNSNIGAITLISDGNYNEGNHPIYDAKNLSGIPIFTLGVGDTITKKDVLIKNIQSNDFVYLNNSFPVEALIEAKKIGHRSVKVRLFHLKKEIASQEIQIRSDEDYYKVNFEIQAKTGGVQRYDIVIDPVPGEFTTKNNAQGFYIDVINDTKKILIISNAPHPDIAAIRGVLEEEKINQVEVKMLSEWKQDASKYDLIIFHNPLVGNGSEIANKITQQKIPLLIILGEQSNFRQAYPFTGFRMQTNGQRDANTPIINNNFELFDLSNETKTQIANFPPLTSTFGRMELRPNVKILAYQAIGGVQKESPQIFFHEVNQSKIGVIFGEGLWRWKLYDFKTKGNADAFQEIIGKTARYLTTKKNNNPFRVTVPRRTKSNEPLILKAEVLNASMENITTSPVSLTLTNEDNKKQTYDFSVIQNYYSLNLGKLPAGTYSWEASTMIEGKKHVQTGQIVMEANHIEFSNNVANYGVLQQLSQANDAAFYPLESYQKLVDAIRQRDDIRPIESQENTVKNLIDYWWLLLLICAVFGTEWFIKKYNGSY